VQDTLGGEKMRPPVTPPQVVLPVQPSPSQHDPRARRFRVNAFAMSGNTVYRTRLLKTLLERFVDLELNLYDLNKAADTITTFYHDRGYTLARAVVPAMLAARRGAIVNVAARAGVAPEAGAAEYAASKAAAIAMMAALAADLAGSGVRVNSILPSIIDTPANRRAMPGADASRWPAPEAIARVVLFLASDDADLVHGASIPVYGHG
jgi:NAD(P)-dependent dehydrogenase (short-subunit alcohol dehydrogenase family)